MFKLLITRNQKIEKLKKACHQLEIDLVGIDLINFSPLPIADLPAVDIVFFYSRRAVDFFFKQKITQNKNFNCGAIGPSTASAIPEKHRVEFVGMGTPKSIAKTFNELYKNKKVLIVRAKTSKNTLLKYQTPSFEYQEIIAYTNEIKTNVEIPEHDGVFITSPLNVKSYANIQPNPPKWVFSIGPTSAQAIRKIWPEIEIYELPQPQLSLLPKFVKKCINSVR